MDVLVFIGNNLKFDTRVKNHSRIIAKHAEHLHILARPVPDHNFYLEGENISSSFFEWEPSEYSCTSRLREIAKKQKIWEILWPVAPVLLEDEYYDPEVIGEIKRISDGLMKNDRWGEIRKGIAEKASDEQEIGWMMSFLDASLQWAEKALDIPADIVYCNDIDTLLCGVAHKKKYGSRLVYDAHDIACDMFPGGFPRRYRDFLARYENAFIQNADAFISVNESAVQWFKRTYHFAAPGVVVSNCMHIQQEEIAIHKLHSPLRLYYHGFCDSTRGIENMLQGILMTEDTELVLRLLPSEYENELRHMVKELKLEGRVRFLEPVSAEKVIWAANEDGDIGIHASRVEQCINLELALTNKFIEYLKAGLPVISVPTAEQSRIIEEYTAGYIIPDNRPETIADILNKVKMEADHYEVMASNALCAAKEQFNGKIHEERLIKTVFNSFSFEEVEKQHDFLHGIQCLKEIKYLKCDLQFWQNEYLKKNEDLLNLKSSYGQLQEQIQKLENEAEKKGRRFYPFIRHKR